MGQYISDITAQARGHWRSIFANMGITIPPNGKHGACPICGEGKDRFRCDDKEGRGTWICAKCAIAGDGLDLVCKVKNLQTMQAAQEVATVLNKTLTLPAKEKALEKADKQKKLSSTAITGLLKKCTVGNSLYLADKGLNHSVLLLPSAEEAELAIFLPIQNTVGRYTGIQLIRADGQKRFLQGSAYKGCFIDLNHYSALIEATMVGEACHRTVNVSVAQSTDLIIITEGFATALTISLMIKANVYAALSANNLLHVAQVLRASYPQHFILLAGDFNAKKQSSSNGDNKDNSKDNHNIGVEKATEAAHAVNGLAVIPPVQETMDWDDYRQQYGLDNTAQAFMMECDVQGFDLQPYLRTKILTHQPHKTKAFMTELPANLSEPEYYPQEQNLPEYLPEYVSPSSNGIQLSLFVGSEGFDTQQGYVIKGVLPSNALVSIYGASGSFKSFLAVSFACHVATGTNWAGHKVRQGCVLYIAAEGSIGVARRVRAWEISYNQGQKISNLFRIDRPVYPADPRYQQSIVEQIKLIERKTKIPVNLIIIDTLARCFGGADENTAQDMGAFIQGCDRLKQRSNACVLVVHHTGKDHDRGARGSSAFKAALDAEFSICRDTSNDHALIMACTKMKDAEEPKACIYHLQSVSLFRDEDGEEVTSLFAVDEGEVLTPLHQSELKKRIKHYSDNHKAVLQAIVACTQSQPFCTRKELLQHLKGSGNLADPARKLSQWLNTLVEAKQVEWDELEDEIVPLVEQSE